jgi:cytochrome c-type biogenesis protein
MSVASFAALYVAGLVSFASPCILPLLPLYLSLLGGPHDRSRRRLLLAGAGFTLGLSLVFVVLGMGASALASLLSTHRQVLLLATGALMVVLGLKLAGWVRIDALDRDARPLLARVPSPGGFFGGLLFGAAFSLGWTPCVGPVLGAALSYAASHSSSRAVAGAALATYALGLSTPLLAAAASAPRMLALAARARRASPILQRAAGVALVAMGLLMATDRLSAVVEPARWAEALGTKAAAESDPSCELSTTHACSLPETLGGDATPLALPSGSPHLVEFVAADCPICAHMAPILREVERACGADDGTIVRVLVDSASGRALAQHFGVHAVPTFLRLDAAGNELERIVGAQPREKLALAVESVRGETCTLL